MTPNTEAGHHVGPRTEGKTQRIARLLALDPEGFDWITAEAGSLVRNELRERVAAEKADLNERYGGAVLSARQRGSLNGQHAALSWVLALLGGSHD
jgi:hypothetical protein